MIRAISLFQLPTSIEAEFIYTCMTSVCFMELGVLTFENICCSSLCLIDSLQLFKKKMYWLKKHSFDQFWLDLCHVRSRMVISSCCWSLFAWNIVFHPLTFSLRSLWIQCVSIKAAGSWTYVFSQSVHFLVLIGKCRPLAFGLLSRRT